MSSITVEECPNEAEVKVTHDFISAISPGRDEGEEKNQDRVLVKPAAEGLYAIVCDGTSTSPFSVNAADYVSSQVRQLFQPDGLRQTVDCLKEMRADLLEKPLEIDDDHSAPLRKMFEEIVKQKYECAYQTTFVAVCLKRNEAHASRTISIKAMGCGDSALFIFLDSGKLLYNNANLNCEHDQFKHYSPFTAVLPDCYNEKTDNELFDFGDWPEDAQLLLCSDGFYDCFSNFEEIHGWLNQHHEQLKDSQTRDECLYELHNRLNQSKGDDDISFIWLYPKPEEKKAKTRNVEKEAETEIIRNPGEKPRVGKPGFFRGLLMSLLRLLRLRPHQSVHGQEHDHEPG